MSLRRTARAFAAAWWLGLLCLFTAANAEEGRDVAADPQLEARVLAIAGELRCLVCQNQTIAESHAGLAVDLRREIRSMLKGGSADADVLRFMTERYGDFVRYRPPVRASTWLLWFGPAALLLAAVAALLLHLRRRAALPDTAFEADDEDPEKVSHR